MPHRRLHKLLRTTAFLLAFVWLSGPTGAAVEALMEPVHLHCHCPGHAHPESAPTGPTFAPCDHDAAATLAGERMITPAFSVTVALTVTTSALPLAIISIPTGVSPFPEAPPPKLA